MKRVFIIHGYDAAPSDNWFPWLKAQLENQGFQVTVPQMPEAADPTLQKWLAYLQKIVGVCDHDTYFVGHSLGTITVLKLLNTLPENQKVGGVVLVAGFSESIDFEKLSSFTETPLNYEKVEQSVGQIVAIHSTDDQSVPYKFAQIIKDKLGAELITLKNAGHINAASGYFELPQALDAILKISKTK